ncbi:MAG: C10 family peptidase, partial [Prolixibacteraceae bacterium]|nr:C10 family peptidase [Prolixibacteraceae bacterium]
MKIFLFKMKYWQATRISILSLILMICMPAFSQNTENQAAKNYAVDFLNARQQSKSSLKSAATVSSITQSYQSPDQVKTPLFVFQQPGKGFAIVAQSHNTYKVVGYSEEATFQAENIPPQLRALMSYYEDSLTFMNPVSTPLKAGTPIVPALLDAYGIRLNQYQHTELGNCPTGCIATAVTQIMLYHAARLGKPIKGYGSHCYTDAKYGELCADFENADYSSDNTLLSLHVGQAMEMQYCGSPYGSVPNIGFANPLQEHFKFYTGNAIPDNFYIKNELEHQRPVYIELNGKPVGHALVLDGYDSRGYYHVNFGWNGIYNGYYLLNNSDRIGISNFKFYTNIFRPVVISPTPPRVTEQDSLALVAVHNAIGGYEVTNWDLTKPVWTWPGILTMNDRVIRLAISSPIPTLSSQSIAPEIGNLTALQELSFGGCLSGVIPSTITKLTDLKK